MDHYLDIKIVPDEEVPVYFIRNKIYTKLHKGLSTLGSTDIGVSFPKYRVKLGDVVRVHGNVDRLKELQAMNWLGGLSGYCHISDIALVSQHAKQRNISRIQSNMTEAKLRRLIKRGSFNPDNVQQYKVKMFEQGLSQPYLELESVSNGHKHRRYIQFGEVLDNRVEGEFDAFGLSKVATVPWF